MKERHAFKADIKHEIIGKKLIIPGDRLEIGLSFIRGIYEEYQPEDKKQDRFFYKKVEGVGDGKDKIDISGLTNLFLTFGRFLGKFDYRFSIKDKILKDDILLYQFTKDRNWTATKIHFLEPYHAKFSNEQKAIFEIVQANQESKLALEKSIRQRDALPQIVDMLSQLEQLSQQKVELQANEEDDRQQHVQEIPKQISDHINTFKIKYAEILSVLNAAGLKLDINIEGNIGTKLTQLLRTKGDRLLNGLKDVYSQVKKAVLLEFDSDLDVLTGVKAEDDDDRKADAPRKSSDASLQVSIKRHVDQGTLYQGITEKIDAYIKDIGPKLSPDGYCTVTEEKVYKDHVEFLEQKKETLNSKIFRRQHSLHCMDDKTLLIVEAAAFLYNMHCELIQPTKKDSSNLAKKVRIGEAADFKAELLKFDDQFIQSAIDEIKGITFFNEHREDAAQFFEKYFKDKNDSTTRDMLCEHVRTEVCERSLKFLKRKFSNIGEGKFLEVFFGTRFSVFWAGNQEAILPSLNIIKMKLLADIADTKDTPENNEFNEKLRGIINVLDSFSTPIQAVTGALKDQIRTLTQRINNRYHVYQLEKVKQACDQQVKDLKEKLQELTEESDEEKEIIGEDRIATVASKMIAASNTAKANLMLRSTAKGLELKVYKLNNSYQLAHKLSESRNTILSRKNHELGQQVEQGQNENRMLRDKARSAEGRARHAERIKEKLESQNKQLSQDVGKETRERLSSQRECARLQSRLSGAESVLNQASAQMKPTSQRRKSPKSGRKKASDRGVGGVAAGTEEREFSLLGILADEQFVVEPEADYDMVNSSEAGSGEPQKVKHRGISNIITQAVKTTGLSSLFNGLNISHERIKDLEKENSTYQVQITKLKNQVENVQRAGRTAVSEVARELDELRLEIQAKTEQAERQIKLKGLIRELESDKVTLTCDNHEQSQTIIDNKDRIRKNELERISLNERLQNVCRDLDAQKKTYEDFEGRYSKQVEECREFKEKNIELESAKNKLQQEKMSLETKVALQSAQITDGNTKEKAISREQEQIEALKIANDKLAQEKNSLEQSVQTSQEQREQAQKDNEALALQLHKRDQELKALRSENIALVPQSQASTEYMPEERKSAATQAEIKLNEFQGKYDEDVNSTRGSRSKLKKEDPSWKDVFEHAHKTPLRFFFWRGNRTFNVLRELQILDEDGDLTNTAEADSEIKSSYNRAKPR